MVASPRTKKSLILKELVKKNGVNFYPGSLDNVLDRHIKAAEKFKIDPIIRITADCPLIDPVLIDQVIRKYNRLKEQLDYFFIKGYPQGLGDIEIVTLEALKRSARLTKKAPYLEHVITFILENPSLFKVRITKSPRRFYRPGLKLCVDEIADLTLVRRIYRHFAPRIDFSFQEVIKYLDEKYKIRR